MNSFEFNKMAGAVLSAMLLVMVIGLVTDGIFHAEVPEQPAYFVELPDAGDTATAEAEVDQGPTLAELLVLGDVGRGERAFRKCQACHTVEQGGRNGTGPNLYNLVGRALGAGDGFNYSSALIAHGGNWNYEALDAFLANPRQAIPGNKMSFAGLRRPGERADVIAYLRQFGDNPPPLPAVEAAAEVVEEAPAAEDGGAPAEPAEPAADNPAEGAGL